MAVLLTSLCCAAPAPICRAPSAPPGFAAKAEHLYDKLILRAQTDNGTIPLFKRQDAVSQRFVALTIRMDALNPS